MYQLNKRLPLSLLLIATICLHSCEKNERLCAGLLLDELYTNDSQDKFLSDSNYVLNFEQSDFENGKMCFNRWSTFYDGRIEVWSTVYAGERSKIDRDAFSIDVNVIDEENSLSRDSIFRLVRIFERENLFPNFSVTKLHDNFWTYKWKK